ncbi:MAG: carboxypeptidase regulatory-like domain-containing protein [Acidobacteriota bacterium]
MRRRFVPLLLIAGLTGALMGQTFTGSVTGVVTDPAGAVVPGARVTLTNTLTQAARTTATNETGRYTFSQLLPSTYSLKVSAAGFKEHLRKGVALGTNESIDLGVELALGQLAEVVEVSETAPLLNTQTPTESVTLDSKAMAELPMKSRVPFVLVHSTPGVVAVRTGVTASIGDQDYNRFAMNGGRDESVLILIDGVQAQSILDWGGLLASPGAESVSEVQVIRNTYEAQFGKSGGGVVNMTTKAGSREFHGALWEFLGNDNLDANDFFSNKFGRPKREFKRNEFGFNLGGPIWKKQGLYGFFGYEGLRQFSPVTRVTTVPTGPQREGNFSQTFNTDGSLAVIYDPLTTRPGPGGSGFIRDPFPGNTFLANRRDPVAAKVINLYPPANMAGVPLTSFNNYFESGTLKTVNDRYDARGDWAHNAKHTMFARITRAFQDSRAPYLGFGVASPTADSINPRYHLSVGNTFVLSPTLVANLLIGGGSWTEDHPTPGLGFDATSLGFSPDLVRQFDAQVIPGFVITDYSDLGNSSFNVRRRHVASVDASASKELASHSLRFGWSLDNAQQTEAVTNSAIFNFDRFFTSGPNPDARNIRAGNSLASLLLGAGSGGNAPRNIMPALTQTYWAWYAQDTWRVNRRLTFTYGLRYEVQTARTERFNRLNYFDYDAVSPIGAPPGRSLKGGLVFAGSSARGVWDAPLTNLAPRLGLAFKLSDRLVARAGYGIFYLRAATTVSGTSSTQGFSTATPWLSTLDGGRTPYHLLRNPYPQGIAGAPGPSGGLLTQVGLNIAAFQREHPTPYMQQYSLDLQFQVSKNLLLELGYVGNQGRKLLYGYNFQRNQLPDAALALGSTLLDQVPNPFFGVIKSGPLAAAAVQRGQLLRPYPHFTDVHIINVSGASSTYNGGTAKVTKRFSDGLSIMAFYQFSRAIDNASEDQAWEVGDRARNFNNLALERSISAHDIPHDVAVNFVYELPVGKGKTLGGALHPIVERAIGGWQLAGIFKWQSGLPLMFSAPNNTFSFGGSQFPNVSDVKAAKYEAKTVDRWFNTAAFSQPPPFTFGNAPRYLSNVRVHALNSWDISAAKNFPIRERLRIQFRGMLFNAFNRARFGPPDTNVASPGFGRISGLGQTAPRSVQFGLRISF